MSSIFLTFAIFDINSSLSDNIWFESSFIYFTAAASDSLQI